MDQIRRRHAGDMPERGTLRYERAEAALKAKEDAIKQKISSVTDLLGELATNDRLEKYVRMGKIKAEIEASKKIMKIAQGEEASALKLKIDKKQETITTLRDELQTYAAAEKGSEESKDLNAIKKYKGQIDASKIKLGNIAAAISIAKSKDNYNKVASEESKAKSEIDSLLGIMKALSNEEGTAFDLEEETNSLYQKYGIRTDQELADLIAAYKEDETDLLGQGYKKGSPPDPSVQGIKTTTLMHPEEGEQEFYWLDPEVARQSEIQSAKTAYNKAQERYNNSTEPEDSEAKLKLKKTMLEKQKAWKESEDAAQDEIDRIQTEITKVSQKLASLKVPSTSQTHTGPGTAPQPSAQPAVLDTQSLKYYEDKAKALGQQLNKINPGHEQLQKKPVQNLNETDAVREAKRMAGQLGQSGPVAPEDLKNDAAQKARDAMRRAGLL